MNTVSTNRPTGEKDWYDRARELESIPIVGSREQQFDLEHIRRWTIALQLKIGNAMEAAEEFKPEEHEESDPNIPPTREFLERARLASLRLVSILEEIYGDNWSDVTTADSEPPAVEETNLSSSTHETLIRLIKTGNRHMHRFWTCMNALFPKQLRPPALGGDTRFSYSSDAVLDALGLLTFTEDDEPLD